MLKGEILREEDIEYKSIFAQNSFQKDGVTPNGVAGLHSQAIATLNPPHLYNNLANESNP